METIGTNRRKMTLYTFHHFDDDYGTPGANVVVKERYFRDNIAAMCSAKRNLDLSPGKNERIKVFRDPGRGGARGLEKIGEINTLPDLTYSVKVNPNNFDRAEIAELEHRLKVRVELLPPPTV
jgi:hypothetical protein